MTKHRRKLTALLTGFLLLLLAGGTGLWLRSARHQYALNRRLIEALVKGDDKRAVRRDSQYDVPVQDGTN